MALVIHVNKHVRAEEWSRPHRKSIIASPNVYTWKFKPFSLNKSSSWVGLVFFQTQPPPHPPTQASSLWLLQTLQFPEDPTLHTSTPVHIWIHPLKCHSPGPLLANSYLFIKTHSLDLLWGPSVLPPPLLLAPEPCHPLHKALLLHSAHGTLSVGLPVSMHQWLAKCVSPAFTSVLNSRLLCQLSPCQMLLCLMGFSKT